MKIIFIIALLISSYFCSCEEYNSIDLRNGVLGVRFHSNDEFVFKTLGPPAGVVEARDGGEIWIYSDNLYIKLLDSELIGVTIGHGELPVNGAISSEMKQIDKYRDITGTIKLFDNILFGESFESVSNKIKNMFNKDIDHDKERLQAIFTIDGYKIMLRFMETIKYNLKNELANKITLSFVQIEAIPSNRSQIRTNSPTPDTTPKESPPEK